MQQVPVARFDPDGSHAELRRREYGRLDASGSAYLDYTGSSLHAASQLAAHAELLRTRVFGNPHSTNPASMAATAEVERARDAVLSFFGTTSDDYVCIFTPNATGGLKLVADSYPLGPGSVFALTADNHNSVNGIREIAARAGARIEYVPVRPPDLRVDRDRLDSTLAGRGRRAAPRLFAYPAESNYSGVQHPLGLVANAEGRGWDVLLDASAFVATNRLDLGAVRPAFVVASFYKVFGYPTGVGCLLVRRDRLGALRRPWFAGGTVTFASVGAGGHYLNDAPAGFEDGTVDFLNLPAVTIGLEHIERVGRDRIHRRVDVLTGWLLDELGRLRHADGRPVVRVLGPTTTEARGGTVTFLVHDRDGRPIAGRHVEMLADRRNISVRSGCFCNPGAAEAALGVAPEDLAGWFGRRQAVTVGELYDGMERQHGRTLDAVRASFGIASNLDDAQRLVDMLGDVAAAGPVGRLPTAARAAR